MKKILTFLVLMIIAPVVFIALSSSTQPEPGRGKSLDKVSIFIRYVTNNNEKKLSMNDSNGESAYNDLKTRVHAGGTITWKLDQFSGIVSIDNIYTEDKKSEIFKNKAIKSKGGKQFTLQIPAGLTGEVKYIIEFNVNGKKRIKIDPYIKVVPPDDKE